MSRKARLLTVDRVFVAIDLKDCHTVFFIPIEFHPQEDEKEDKLKSASSATPPEQRN